jgi:hypothetical protein
LRFELGCGEDKTQDLRVSFRGPPGGKVQKKEHQDAAQQARKHVERRCAHAHGEEEELPLCAKDGEWAMEGPIHGVDSSLFGHAAVGSKRELDYEVGNSQARKLTAAMAMPTPKSTPARTRFEPPSPKAKVKPATTMATSERPRAISVVNAVIKTVTAFSQGDVPVVWAKAAVANRMDEENVTNAGQSQRETDFLRKNFFIAGEFLSDDASQTRIGIRRQSLAELCVAG